MGRRRVLLVLERFNPSGKQPEKKGGLRRSKNARLLNQFRGNKNVDAEKGGYLGGYSRKGLAISIKFFPDRTRLSGGIGHEKRSPKSTG